MGKLISFTSVTADPQTRSLEVRTRIDEAELHTFLNAAQAEIQQRVAHHLVEAISTHVVSKVGEPIAVHLAANAGRLAEAALKEHIKACLRGGQVAQMPGPNGPTQ